MKAVKTQVGFNGVLLVVGLGLLVMWLVVLVGGNGGNAGMGGAGAAGYGYGMMRGMGGAGMMGGVCQQYVAPWFLWLTFAAGCAIVLLSLGNLMAAKKTHDHLAP